MYVWTRKEIAARFDVTPAAVGYWIKRWDEKSDHPFPAPVGKVQYKRRGGLTIKQDIYGVGAVLVWHDEMPVARKRRTGDAMRTARLKRKVGLPLHVTGDDQLVTDLKALLTVLERT